MSTNKDGRALLVVSSLVTDGPENWGWLYSFLESTGVSAAQTMLGPLYASCEALSRQKSHKRQLHQCTCALGGVTKHQSDRCDFDASWKPEKVSDSRVLGMILPHAT